MIHCHSPPHSLRNSGDCGLGERIELKRKPHRLILFETAATVAACWLILRWIVFSRLILFETAATVALIRSQCFPLLVPPHSLRNSGDCGVRFVLSRFFTKLPPHSLRNSGDCGNPILTGAVRTTAASFSSKQRRLWLTP